MKHTCHWPGCDVEVPPAMWGCKAHWFRLPLMLRDEIKDAYRPGQEIYKRPSEKYLVVARLAQGWISGKVVLRPDGRGFDVLEDLEVDS